MTLATPIIHHPFNFHIGPIPLTGFGIAMLLAFVIAQIVSERELARRGHDKDAAAVGDVLIAALVGTLVGAKLYYVAVVTHDFRDFWSRGGFVFWGGFMGAVAVCALTIRYKRLSFARFADVAGLAIAAGYSVGRTGCWAVGDDYGKPWSGPLAVAFPDGAPPSTVANLSRDFHVQFPLGTNPSDVIAVYPTQLLETLLGFAMFGILWRMRDHKHAEGWLFGVWCIFAGIERFIVEFFRAKDDRLAFPGGLSVAQVIAIAVMATGVVVMVARKRGSGIYGRVPAGTA
jgi:phosphatidylglycerol:prolipoprotein diacylglycerol transferase